MRCGSPTSPPTTLRSPRAQQRPYATTARPHPGPTTRPAAFTFVTHVSPVLGVDCIVTEGYDKYAATGADSDRLELQGLNDLHLKSAPTDVDILGDC